MHTLQHVGIALAIFAATFCALLPTGVVPAAVGGWSAASWFYVGRERRQLEVRRGSNRIPPWAMDAQFARQAGIPMLVTGALAAWIAMGMPR
jgi:hypothetical protein